MLKKRMTRSRMDEDRDEDVDDGTGQSSDTEDYSTTIERRPGPL